MGRQTERCVCLGASEFDVVVVVVVVVVGVATCVLPFALLWLHFAARVDLCPMQRRRTGMERNRIETLAPEGCPASYSGKRYREYDQPKAVTTALLSQ